VTRLAEAVHCAYVPRCIRGALCICAVAYCVHVHFVHVVHYVYVPLYIFGSSCICAVLHYVYVPLRGCGVLWGGYGQ